MNILFVCNANKGRSAMAECYFNHLCKQNKLLEVASYSAGIDTTDGEPASAKAVELMKGLGLNLEKHITCELDKETVEDSDAVIVMTGKQAEALRQSYPEAAEKIDTLLTFNGSDGDVEDPTGEDLESVQNCFLSMMPALASLCDRIIRSQH